MSQERWDVVLRFLNGPLQFEGDVVMRGPVVRLGSNPGPSGLKLDGYRAVDDRHAVVSAYIGGTVQIAPVGTNQVRVSPHENVDWNGVQPIRGPVFLSDGCAVHVGPPGRGATFTFVECRRLGVWEQGSLVSEVTNHDDTVGEASSTRVKALDLQRRIPWWFIPGLGFMVFGTLGFLGIVVLVLVQNQVEPLGPEEPGPDYYEYGDVFAITEIDAGLRMSNTGDGFRDFVTSINSELADDKSLADPQKADPALLDWVTRAQQMHIRGWSFWRKLDDARERYAMVVRKLRAKNLPEVLAGVPFQESGYNPAAKDRLLCAYGMWQFQPEIAYRNGMKVTGCHNSRSTGGLWEPKEKALPIRAIENAEYVLDGRCTISSCDVDERDDPERATDGAIANFLEPWRDQAFKESGAMGQLLIATHNAGYNDSKWRSNGKVSRTNIGVSYPLYLKTNNVKRAPDFIGRNITCTNPSQMIKSDVFTINATCGGYLPSVTQTYVPYVIAQHLLAVCYYGAYYADEPAFAPYAKYTVGYCRNIKVPTPDEVRARGGK
jgi:hypothetical protein